MNNITLQATKEIKLLGVTLDSKLNMKKYHNNMINKGTRRINQLQCVTNYFFRPS